MPAVSGEVTGLRTPFWIVPVAMAAAAFIVMKRMVLPLSDEVWDSGD